MCDIDERTHDPIDPETEAEFAHELAMERGEYDTHLDWYPYDDGRPLPSERKE